MAGPVIRNGWAVKRSDNFLRPEPALVRLSKNGASFYLKAEDYDSMNEDEFSAYCQVLDRYLELPDSVLSIHSDHKVIEDITEVDPETSDATRTVFFEE